MSQPLPAQHPAVVLRSAYDHIRALLAVAMIAVVALAATVVILAINDDGGSTVAGTPASAAAPSSPGAARYDGGPEEGTRGADPRSRHGLHVTRP